MQNQNYQNQQPLINDNQQNFYPQISSQKYLPTLNSSQRQNIVVCVSNETNNYRVSGMSREESMYRCEKSRVAISIQCPCCGNAIITQLQYQSGQGTYLCCCLLLCCGLFFCSWLPFCLDSCQDVIHVCPNCHNEIGKSKYQVC